MDASGEALLKRGGLLLGRAPDDVDPEPSFAESLRGGCAQPTRAARHERDGALLSSSAHPVSLTGLGPAQSSKPARVGGQRHRSTFPFNRSWWTKPNSRLSEECGRLSPRTK